MSGDIFRTVARECEAEIEEKRSVFIAAVKRVATEEEAMAFVKERKKLHPDARHTVFAYVLRKGAARYSDDSEPPHIIFKDDAKNYEFATSFDSGTGTSCKSLILFDLSVLELSMLPVLIHDSVIHKQIEDHAFGKILELYQKSGKQVFIAMDKQETFGKEIYDTLEDACVLHLSGGGNELFGRAWNKKSNR